MTRRRPEIGAVIQFALPDGQFAYGRVLRDASVGFYATRSKERGQPPIGERDYEFVVGVYDDVLRSDDLPIVGHDPAAGPDDEWPPPYCVRDVISSAVSIYHHGEFRHATTDECRGLEPAAVWDRAHLIARLLESSGAARRTR